MKFEYDPDKSRTNREKHGIDFEHAKKLWNDETYVEVSTTFEGESRSLVIGMIGGKCYTAIITYREEATRIISVRRSRKKEVDFYESFGA